MILLNINCQQYAAGSYFVVYHFLMEVLMKSLFASRRVSCAILMAAAFSQSAYAAYPEKPVRWIVNAGAGGAADSSARVVATELTKRMGQPFIIDNRPGAAGAIGLDAVAKAAPDGYTIGTANLSTFIVGALVARKLPYSTAKDFTPIGMLTTQPNMLGVNAALPIRSMTDLKAYSKNRPNELFYGSSGTGTALHVVTELFIQSAGIKATHVPYKSTVAAEADLAAGQIQLMIDNFSTMLPNIESKRVRPIAITGPKRSPLLPDVPTMAEAGVPAAEMVTWGGVVGPARLPVDIQNRLNSEINAVLTDPAVIKQLLALGSDAAPMSISQFSEVIKKDNEKWSAVIKGRNISVD